MIVAVTGLALILLATLRPAVPGYPSGGPFCVVCGEIGTIDITQNVVLFLPLGAGLGLLGARRGMVLLVAFALSASIELLQLLVITGRYGTVSDVLTNSLGALLGHLLVVRRINPLDATVTARLRLPALASIAWLLLLLVPAIALRPAAPAGRAGIATHDADLAGRRFMGTVLGVELDQVALPLGRAVPDDALRRITAPRSIVAADVIPSLPTASYVTLLRLGAIGRTGFVLGQDERDLVCQRRMTASNWRVRTPAFRLPDAFPDSASLGAPAATLSVQCERRHGEMILRRIAPGDSLTGGAPLTLGHGWSLFLPARLPVGPPALPPWWWKNVAWLVVIAFFAGFWAVLLAVRTTDTKRSSNFRRVLAVTATLAAAAFAGHQAAPLSGTVASSPWWEVTASLAGIALGTLLGAFWWSEKNGA